MDSQGERPIGSTAIYSSHFGTVRQRVYGDGQYLQPRNITSEQLEEMEENVYLAEFHAAKGHTQQIV